MTAAYDDAVDVLVLAVHCTTNKVIIEKSCGEQYLFKKSFVFWHSAPTLNLGSTESTFIVLPNGSILCLQSQIMIFPYSILAISQRKIYAYLWTLNEDINQRNLKIWPMWQTNIFCPYLKIWEWVFGHAVDHLICNHFSRKV